MTSLDMPGQTGRSDQTLAHNMKLLAHHELDGFGGLGEGIAMQQTDDGRRILWLAHESAPKNFSGVDVTDPTQPRLIVQTEMPHMKVRSNSLDVVGNVMAVAYQVVTPGMKPAGFENGQDIISAAYLKDVSDPQWDKDPGMKTFLDFLQKDFPEGNKLDGSVVVGYGAAQTLVQVLRQCGDNLTRENVMKQAASLKDFRTEMLLPGIKINTSATDFAPISQLQLMRFKGEKWDLFGEIISSDVGG